MSEAGEVYIVNNLHLSQQSRYEVDPSCNLKTQDPSFNGTGEGGMTLVYPYFVGLGKVCFIDEARKRIGLMNDFKKQLPRNAFTIIFAGGDNQHLYFVMNGRIYPE